MIRGGPFDGRAQARLGRLHILDQRATGRDLDFQFGDADGDFARQIGLALAERRAGRAFVLADLVAEAGHLVFRHAATGHQAGEVVAGLALGGVGVADFLVEDAQGLLIDDRFADFIGAAAQCGEQLAPDGLSHWIFPVDYLKKCSKASLARCTLSTRVFTSVTTLVRLESALSAPNML